jgi:uncharacterized protein DUF4397
MTRLSLFVCCLVAVAAGCKKDATFTEPLPAYAHIIWMNGVSDTGQVDVRVVDIPTNASFMDADFRSTLPFPLNIEPGARHIKVFNSSTADTITSRVLLDTTYTFTDDQPYFFYLSGLSRAGGLRATITTLAPPTPPAGKFAIRVLNLAPSLAGSIRAIPDTTAAPDLFILGQNAKPAGAPSVAGLAYGTMSPYIFVDTGSAYHIALTATGATDPVVTQVGIPPGDVAIAGSHVAGSVLTAIIVARSVPASAAPQTRPASQRTDTSVAEAVRRMTRSGDTVTVQVGSTRVLVNRHSSTGATRADSTIGRTGTAGAAPVTRGQVILVSGATETEYNGWQEVLSVVDTLICSPADPGDVVTGANKKCAPPADTTVASADTALTRFRFRYRIVGAPASPGTGTPVYRIYPAAFTTAMDFSTPQIIFVVDKRP